jgi:DNA-binding NarL/FixJ family response regulator
LLYRFVACQLQPDVLFLMVEQIPRGESLLTQTLARKFPRAAIHYSADPAECLKIGAELPLDAIIVHRAIGITSEEMVRKLRQAMPATPIIMVSVSDRKDSALSAGATQFLLYDEWLMLGQVVSTVLKCGSETSWRTS